MLLDCLGEELSTGAGGLWDEVFARAGVPLGMMESPLRNSFKPFRMHSQLWNNLSGSA